MAMLYVHFPRIYRHYQVREVGVGYPCYRGIQDDIKQRHRDGGIYTLLPRLALPNKSHWTKSIDIKLL